MILKDVMIKTVSLLYRDKKNISTINEIVQVKILIKGIVQVKILIKGIVKVKILIKVILTQFQVSLHI